MKKIFHGKFFLLIIFFIIGAGYRLTSIYPLFWGNDARTFALQAFRILQGGYFPIFYSGQAWMGVAGSYLVALMYKLLGVSSLTLGLFCWLMSGLWLLLTIVLAYRLFGLDTALITSLLFIVPKRSVMEWAGRVRPDYEVFFIMVPLVFLVTHSLIDKFNKERPLKIPAMALGFLSGFGFWTNLSMGPAIIVSFILVIAYLKRTFFRQLLVYYIMGGLLGFSPVIYYNLTQELVLFSQTSAFSNLTELPGIIYAFLTNAFPYFWGSRIKAGQNIILKLSRLCFLVWVVFLYALSFKQGYLRWKRKGNVLNYLLVFGYLLLHLLVTSASYFGKRFHYGDYPTAYITVLHVVSLAIPAAAIAALPSRKLKVLFLLPFLIYISNNLLNTIDYPKRFFKTLKTKGLSAVECFPKREGALFGFCKVKGLTSGYSEGVNKDILNLNYAGEIMLADFYQEHYLPAALKADSAEHFLWLNPPPVKQLKALGCEFKQEAIGGYQVAYDFKKDFISENLITDYIVEVSNNRIKANFLTDRNITTFWHTVLNRDAQEIITFIFKEPEKISKLVIFPSSYATFPGRFSLEVSLDGKEWKEVLRSAGNPHLFWSVFHPFIKIVKPRMELVIPEAPPAKYCRIKIAVKEKDLFPVALSEVYLYKRLDESIVPWKRFKQEIGDIIEYVVKQGRKRIIIADHWFENHFKRLAYRVEFISNRFVNNCGMENPYLKKRIPVDFSQPSVIIVPKSHSPFVEKLLKEQQFTYKLNRFTVYDVLVVEAKISAVDLYWNGLDLNKVIVREEGKKYALEYPSLEELFDEVTNCEYYFGNDFCLSAYKIDYKSQRKNISLNFEITPLKVIKEICYLFIHFCDKDGRILFQGDFKIENQAGTPDFWEVGKKVLLHKKVLVPDNIAGKLTVKVGIWHPKLNKRLIINSEAGELLVAGTINLD